MSKGLGAPQGEFAIWAYEVAQAVVESLAQQTPAFTDELRELVELQIRVTIANHGRPPCP